MGFGHDVPMLPGDMRKWRENVRASCEELGQESVRQRLAAQLFSGRKRTWAQEWLEEIDAAKAAEEAAAQREIDRSIAREANRISFWIGISGNVVALLALGVAIYAALK